MKIQQIALKQNSRQKRHLSENRFSPLLCSGFCLHCSCWCLQGWLLRDGRTVRRQNLASSDFDEDLADINYDGIITVTDVMGLVNVILFSNTHQVPANAITTFENMTMMPTADGFELSTENAYTACQMTVVLPEGGKLTGAYGPSGSKAMVNDLGGGRFNVVVYSPEGQPLSSDGSLVKLQIRGNSRGISISDMQLTNRRLETIIPDEATGITEMAGDSSAGDSYNLQGIKVKTPQRGVYIRNGKKETVK